MGAGFFIMKVIFKGQKQDLIDYRDPLILYTGGGTPLRAGAGTLKELSHVPARTEGGHLLKCPQTVYRLSALVQTQRM